MLLSTSLEKLLYYDHEHSFKKMAPIITEHKDIVVLSVVSKWLYTFSWSVLTARVNTHKWMWKSTKYKINLTIERVNHVNQLHQQLRIKALPSNKNNSS
jgi:hypothetical protein